MNRQSRQTMNYASIGLLIVALAVSITFNVTGIRDQAGQQSAINVPKSIAVLPFTSRSNDPDNIIFADGIHDDLLTKLAKIAALKVISRTSVLEYRDTTKNVRQIGRELGVDTILSGTVQRDGDAVRIQMRLVDARTDTNLWADSFDRQLTMQSIFELQSEISESVSGVLRARLSPTEQIRTTASIPTRDLRAYSLYSKARNNLSERLRETLLEARTQFEEAIAFDPEYAQAHAGLAESVLLLMINHKAVPYDEAIALAAAEIDRALELDPDLADAYAINGLLEMQLGAKEMMGENNIAAENAFRKAIELNPSHASAYMWFASLRDAEGRLDEAISLYQQAMDVDPLARIPFSNLPMIYAKQGHHQQALNLWLNAVGIHPEWPTIYQYVSTHLMGLGRLDEALAWHKKASELDSGFMMGSGAVGIYYELGELDKAKALLLAVPADHPLAAMSDGIRKLLDGELSPALQSFEQIIESGDFKREFAFDVAADTALLANELDRARKLVLMQTPELGGDAQLEVNNHSVDDVIRLAYIHKETGNEQRARELLTAALPVIQEQPRMGTFGHGIRDVEIFALLGRTEDALLTLREAVDTGFRTTIMQNAWTVQQDPFLKSIRNDQRFTSIVNEIATYVEAMRINVERAELSGDWDTLRARAEVI